MPMWSAPQEISEKQCSLREHRRPQDRIEHRLYQGAFAESSWPIVLHIVV
jgi:hypothetical protein